MTTPLHVTSTFDSGNITVLSAADPGNITLEITPEPFCESDGRAHFQWFHFRVIAPAHTPLTLRITNAGKASFSSAWRGYRAAASYDRENFFRVEDTTYDSDTGTLTISHTPTSPSVWYAYFAPFSQEMHHNLIAQSLHAPRLHPTAVPVELLVPGLTLDGRPVEILRCGAPAPGKRAIWVVARQHPGESMAEHWVAGLLPRLLDRHDPQARALLQKAVFYVVPNANPDGSVRGHLRVNAAGANLNREWAEPSLDRSPEVYHIRAVMDAVGCDLFLDVHGDEELPYNFIAGTHGIPAWSPRLAALLSDFKNAYEARCPADFQQKAGYPQCLPGRANLKIAGNAVAQRFGCLSMTLEQPFKDCAGAEDAERGWSPERARRFGAAVLEPLAEVVGRLREREE